ncbi:[LysW]-aminoadipate kinase [Streptomyces triticagri]|uniref:[LysW]-aminoadipate kinase n=1 Tax=Streptomyces triticagri TaxID=2293568 RepID=A0A372LXN9_9ACTN|nr:[LysW]-aminoadipate kinase [Streptomyces triticagri]RFU83416.1 [LysW]-aminoadipate kinase [Streptomyces triticagri]
MGNGLTVVKCGGAAGVDPVRVCADVARLVESGERVVLVHGGSAELDLLAERLGVPRRTLTARSGVTSRYTDDATLEVLTLALAGQVKPALLTELAGHGIPATGLTGIDAGLLRARRKKAIRARVDGRTVLVRDDHSGRISELDPAVLKVLLDAGITPVVSPPALAEDGRPVNVNADRVAAAVAAGLGARRLLFLTAAPGVLADPEDAGSRLEQCELPADGGIPGVGGGMLVKLIAAREALEGGVREVLVGDGRVQQPIRRALDGESTAVVLRPDAPGTGHHRSGESDE